MADLNAKQDAKEDMEKEIERIIEKCPESERKVRANFRLSI